MCIFQNRNLKTASAFKKPFILRKKISFKHFKRKLYHIRQSFTSTISLRTANWNKWEKLFIDLVTLSTGSTYSLDLFIRFGNLIYSIWWLYLLALFSGFIYSMAVFILLDGSVYWTYLLDLFYGFTYSLDLYIRFGGFTYSPYL